MNLKTITSIVLFFTMLSLSKAQTGDLVIFTTDGVAIHAALDGKFQNKQAATNLKISNVPEGNYSVTLLFNNKQKGIKSTIRIISGNENSFIVDNQTTPWKLKSYSVVPLSQVGATSSQQIQIAYNRTGIELNGIQHTNELADNAIAQAPSYTRVHGTTEELRKEAEKNRSGQFRSTPSTNQQPNNTNKPVAKEGTTIVKRYIKTENADGTVSIVEEATTTIKEIVTRNGQQQMRTKRSVAMTPTDFTCLPMEAAAFKTLLEQAKQNDKAQRLAFVQEKIKGACLTPAQIKNIGGLFEDKEELHLFAQSAQTTVADPNNFPYTEEAVTIVEEPVEPIEEPIEIIQTPEPVTEVPTAIKETPTAVVTKTKAELRAELKAAKAKLKAAKKAAKAEAKAAKKAAKAKEKAARSK